MPAQPGPGGPDGEAQLMACGMSTPWILEDAQLDGLQTMCADRKKECLEINQKNCETANYPDSCKEDKRNCIGEPTSCQKVKVIADCRKKPAPDCLKNGTHAAWLKSLKETDDESIDHGWRIGALGLKPNKFVHNWEIDPDPKLTTSKTSAMKEKIPVFSECASGTGDHVWTEALTRKLSYLKDTARMRTAMLSTQPGSPATPAKKGDFHLARNIPASCKPKDGADYKTCIYGEYAKALDAGIRALDMYCRAPIAEYCKKSGLPAEEASFCPQVQTMLDATLSDLKSETSTASTYSSGKGKAGMGD